MPTRDLANKRITIAIGAANAIADLSQPLDTELNAMLQASPAIRWDGLDFGAQASEQVDDRSLDDDAASVLRGFAQFGGAIPFFLPKVTDTTSILRQVFNLVKTNRTPLVIAERVGFKSTNQAWAAGDNVNTYLVMVDGFAPDTEGTGGYAGLFNMIPQGTTYPWAKVKAASPLVMTQIGGATITITGTAIALRGAALGGDVVTSRAIWTTSDATKAKIVGKGIVQGVAAGSATITASIPGATPITFATTVS
jgi:hypothetical protein